MEICDETGTDGAVTLQFNIHEARGSKEQPGGSRRTADSRRRREREREREND